MSLFPTRTVIDRLGGTRPSSPRAVGAAAAVGMTAAVVTYRLLRHQGGNS
jgi:hypothetical protein